MTNVRVLNDFVLVEPDPNHFVADNPEIERIVSEGLIKLPDNNSLEKRSASGSVVSCGPKCHYDFKVGQKVYYGQWGSYSFYHFINGKKLRFFSEHEIIAAEEEC